MKDRTRVHGVEAVFWDNDGVLVDTEQLYFEVTAHVLASVGVPLNEPQFVELFLRQGRGAWHLAEEHGISPADIDRLRARRNALYSEWLVRAPRRAAGIERVLDALHGTYLMGVVTSSSKDHFDLIHRNTGLLKYFDFVLTASDVRRVKPDPELYCRAVERAGVAQDGCVAIEDSERGLAAASAAGVACIVVPTALTAGCRFDGARRVLGSLGEILDVL